MTRGPQAGGGVATGGGGPCGPGSRTPRSWGSGRREPYVSPKWAALEISLPGVPAARLGKNLSLAVGDERERVAGGVLGRGTRRGFNSDQTSVTCKSPGRKRRAGRKLEGKWRGQGASGHSGILSSSVAIDPPLDGRGVYNLGT